MVPPSVQEKFRVWPVTFLIAQELWSLLGILRPTVETLPKDPRNIMKTQQQYEISQTCGGENYHVFRIVVVDVEDSKRSEW
jgi:hypothetical protein